MKVIVIYGSPNDKPFMEPAREYFAQENVPYEETVLSAHRDLPELVKFLRVDNLSTTELTEQILQANISGSPFSLPAGKVFSAVCNAASAFGL